MIWGSDKYLFIPKWKNVPPTFSMAKLEVHCGYYRGMGDRKTVASSESPPQYRWQRTQAVPRELPAQISVSVKSVSRELPGTVYFLTLRSPLPPQEGSFPFLGRSSTTVAKVSLRVSLQVFCWLRGNGLDQQLVLANIPIGLFVVIYRFRDFCLKSKQGTENSIWTQSEIPKSGKVHSNQDEA